MLSMIRTAGRSKAYDGVLATWRGVDDIYQIPPHDLSEDCECEPGIGGYGGKGACCGAGDKGEDTTLRIGSLSYFDGRRPGARSPIVAHPPMTQSTVPTALISSSALNGNSSAGISW